MCGRYTSYDDEDECLWNIYQQTQQHYPSAVLKRGEILPTDTAPILFGKDMLAVPAKFGYPSPTGKGILINARAESAADKATFRESLLNRRCIIPSTGYIEWDSSKTKYRFNQNGSKMLYLGGFCKRINDKAHFVILTTEPNDSVKSIHDRMPIILDPDMGSLQKWNCDTEWALNYLKSEMPQLYTTVIE